MKSPKLLKGVALALAILFAGAQVIRPAKTNPELAEKNALASRLHVPSHVEAMLKRACYDCHSHSTQWPWYSSVAPVSWFVIDHVNEGRGHLNFSEWAKYDAKKAAHKLEEICEMVQAGEMPLKSYLPLHPNARLSTEDVRALCDWANEERTRVGFEVESQEGVR